MDIEAVRRGLALALMGQQLLLALVFLKGLDNRYARSAVALLCLAVVGYLAQIARIEAGVLGVDLLLAALALAVPYVLWEFAHALFELKPVPAWWRPLIYAVPVTLWVVQIDTLVVNNAVLVWLNRAHHIVGIGLILFTTYRVLREQANDLLIGRRRYRFWFVGVIALQVGAVLIVELTLSALHIDAPAWLEVANLVLIAAVSLGLALPLVSINTDVLWTGKPAQGSEANAASASDPDVARLRAHMDAGGYRQSGLSIGQLAGDVALPEHRLRHLINTELGYRNFSDFLNTYRIAAAKQQLVDPAQRRRPVLTIALELGYGSVGPFNRAFKQATGQTPSAYRRAALAEND